MFDTIIRLPSAMKFFGIMLVGLLIIWPVFGAFDTAFVSQETPATLYENLNTGDDTFYSIGDNVTGYQVFTCNTTHVVDLVKLKLYRVGDPGTVTVTLNNVVAGAPGATTHSSGSFVGNALTTSTSGIWYVIYLEPKYTITNGTDYAVCIEHTGTGANAVCWRIDNSDPPWGGFGHTP